MGCWLSKLWEHTKSLPNAADVLLVCFSETEFMYFQKKLFVFFKLSYFHLTHYLEARNVTLSLYRK